MEDRKDPGQLVWGLVLLGLGVLFLLANFGYTAWFIWDRWWPILLIVAGLVILLRRRRAAEADSRAYSPQESTRSSEETGTGTTPAWQPAPRSARPDFPMMAVILIGVGLAFLLDDVFGGKAFPALALIAIGAALLLRERARA